MGQILFLSALFAALSPAARGTTLLEADALFQKRSVEANARAALETYRRLAKDQWRLSMACQFVGFRLTESVEEKKALFQEGVNAGRLSLEKDPDCVPCHFWTGINLALYSDTVGPFRSLMNLKEVRAHLLFVVNKDPGYASAGALRVLGIIEWKLPGVLGGNNAHAKAYLTRAVAELPNEPLNYLFLYKILQDTGDSDEAQSVLLKTASLAEPSDDLVESQEAWRELQSLRASAAVLGLSSR